MPYLKRGQAKPKYKYKPNPVRSNYALYNSRKWRKYSKAFRMVNPLCQVALDRAEVMGADVCDHIVPINQGGSVWDKRNHLAMSHHWHNKKRNLESRGIVVETRTNEEGELIPYNSESIYNLVGEYW